MGIMKLLETLILLLFPLWRVKGDETPSNQSLPKDDENSSNHLAHRQSQRNFGSGKIYQISNDGQFVLGSLNNYNSNSSLAGSSHAKSGRRVIGHKKKTKFTVAMMQSNDRLESDAMNIISTNLGKNWKNFIRQLGYTDARIDQLLITHLNRVSEVIYQCLRDWNESTANATLGCISTLLWKEEHWNVVHLLENYLMERNSSAKQRQSQMN